LLVAVVGELQRDAEVSGAQLGHDLLQRVAVLARYAHGVAQNAGLRLQLHLLDQRNHLPGLLRRNPLHQLDLLPDRGVCGGLNLFVLQVLQRDAALHQLLPQDLFDRLQLVLVLRCKLEGVGALDRDPGLRVFQIEARVDLLGRLIDRVLHLGQVHLAHYVEAVVGCHKGQYKTVVSYRFEVQGSRFEVVGKRRWKLAVVSAAISSSETPRSAARHSAVWTIRAGSLRSPRWGMGARNGASVSTRMRSAGANAATSRRPVALG